MIDTIAHKPSLPPLIGTAGWSIPANVRDEFPHEGSVLRRYSHLMSCAEVNSSFYRPHRRSTWERWADTVPDSFRFSVKMPKAISHVARLVDVEAPLERFITEVTGLGDRLAILLLQLPPSFVFDPEVIAAFVRTLRTLSDVQIAIEPRHLSWFEPASDGWLAELRVPRVAADPAKAPAAATPGGWQGLSYYRLHGSPVVYRSAYEEECLLLYASLLTRDAQAKRKAWCIFDNTANSAALGDALKLSRLLNLDG
jgi:uncharacterized protein YecE (DUF72 family)